MGLKKWKEELILRSDLELSTELRERGIENKEYSDMIRDEILCRIMYHISMEK